MAAALPTAAVQGFYPVHVEESPFGCMRSSSSLECLLGQLAGRPVSAFPGRLPFPSPPLLSSSLLLLPPSRHRQLGACTHSMPRFVSRHG